MLEILVLAAGLGQIVLALGSTAIPRVLRWSEKFAGLEPLERRLFWVYAAYIFGTNLAFGLLSATMPAALVDGASLAAAVTGFITLYWVSRIVIQFACFRGLGPKGAFFVAAEVGLVLLFTFLAAVYGWATVVNVWGVS